ncbi:MAG TPA: nitroreductase [Nocardia sp.]|uniref:nitroreductase n=1 Tax=Nocardia TaxID=1817 RepID=UPI0024554E78|nr:MULTISPECIES: nitroreductase [Nocardia]HLS78233.1 nitroreductase [Nocardia sp.]
MAPTSTPTAEQTALSRILDQRYTCRQFRPDPVPRETIETLLRMAQRTPSWCNTQPWHAVVTEPAATERFRKELLGHIQTAAPAPDLPFPTTYNGVYKERRRECGKQLYSAVGIERGDNAGSMRQMMRNFELFDAPHVAIITTEAELGVYGAVDCGLYISTFLLAAQSLGLGAAPQAALAGYSPFLHEHFGIPEHRQVVAGISFGYADDEHPVNSFRTHRGDLDEAVTFVD